MDREPDPTRWAWLLPWTRYFVTPALRRRGPTAVARASALVLASPVIVVVTLAPMLGPMLDGIPPPIAPAVLALCALCFGLTPFVLRWTGSVDFAGAWLMTCGLLATLIPAYFQHGLGSSITIWLLLAPVIASFFLGGRWSLVIAGVSALAITSLWVLEWFPKAFPAEYFHEEGSGFRWLNSMLGLLAISATALFWDISAERAERERERLEAQVRHSEKLETVGLLAGGVAHDFNNILAAILGHASLLESDVHEPEQRRRVAAIVASCKRASGLVNQMLAYAGRAQTRIETVDLAQTGVNGLDVALLTVLGGHGQTLLAGGDLAVEDGQTRAKPAGQRPPVLIHAVGHVAAFAPGPEQLGRDETGQALGGRVEVNELTIAVQDADAVVDVGQQGIQRDRGYLLFHGTLS